MIAQLIDGLNQRLQQAVTDADYEQIAAIDAACLRYLQDNLPPQTTDETELADILKSLAELQATYDQAKQLCQQASSELQQQLQAAGHNHRNAQRYLDVARNLG